MIQSQLKIHHISKPVGLAFECFDFVVDAFDKPGRDPKEVIVRQPMAVMHKGVGNPFELFDP